MQGFVHALRHRRHSARACHVLRTDIVFAPRPCVVRRSSRGPRRPRRSGARLLATVTPDELSPTRKNPWDPRNEETTLSCLQVILEQEWQHHRYAVCDLDAIKAKSNA